MHQYQNLYTLIDEVQKSDPTPVVISAYRSRGTYNGYYGYDMWLRCYGTCPHIWSGLPLSITHYERAYYHITGREYSQPPTLRALPTKRGE